MGLFVRKTWWPQFRRRNAPPSFALPFSYNAGTEQYVRATAGPPYDAYSMLTDADSDIGNYLVVPLTWTPSGNALSIGGDGIPYMVAAATGRQSATYREWDLSTNAFVPVTGGGYVATYYINNTAPVAAATIDDQTCYTNILFDGPILDDFFNDPEGDTITYSGGTFPTGVSIQSVTLNSGLPNERTVSRIRGTPTAATEGDYSISVTATDSLGDATSQSFTLTVDTGYLVPTVDTGYITRTDALTTIAAAVPGAAFTISYTTTGTVHVDNVSDQYPAGGTYVSRATSFLLTVEESGAGEDSALQDLLDPDENFTGVLIIRRMDAGLTANYYVVPIRLQYRGRSMWVETLLADDNVTKAAKITTALAIPFQPDSPYGN